MLSIIIVEPEIIENLGFIARVIKNFGLHELILINPIDIKEKAYHTAVHAKEILQNARIIKTKPINALNQLKTEFDLLIGTTAKISNDYNLTRSIMESYDFFENHFDFDNKCGLVIGRESSGLTNNELLLCDAIITIATSKEYETMNISHALAVILSQYFRIKSQKNNKKTRITEHFRTFKRNERDILEKKIQKIISYIPTRDESRREIFKKTWLRVLGKAKLTKREGYAMMGFFQKIIYMIEHPK